MPLAAGQRRFTSEPSKTGHGIGRRRGDEPELSGETLRITPQARRWTPLAHQHGGHSVLCPGHA